MALRLRSTDRLFARFARTGDPDALGKVFDRTAAELLHIAAWLVGNRHDAEDILQRTFLTAIEDRASFATQRRVLPWLHGILVHHAHNLRRERARRAALPGQRDSVLDPVAAAAAAEFAASVARAREALGPPYREVLRLQMEEGLNAKEIAARLDRPAGTVRTQLVRGIEQLRKALPAAWVGGLPAAAAPSTLTAMRASLLAAVGHPGPLAAESLAVSGATVASSIVMSKQLVVVAAFVVLGLGVLTYALSSGAWPAPPGAATPSALADAQKAPATDPSTPTTRPDDTARRHALDATPLADAAATLRVRVRWQDDGSPAKGVAVTASLAGMLTAKTSRAEVTDARGTCALHPLQPGTWRIACSHAEASERIDLTGEPHAELDLVAERRAIARGLVVDPAGRPVADARVCVSRPAPGERWYELTRSDADGRFAVPLCGEHRVSARKRGYAPSLDLPAVAGAEPVVEVTLTLRPDGAAVEGTVRDPLGRPVPWANVLVGRPFSPLLSNGPFAPFHRAPLGEHLVADAAGSFLADGLETGPVEVFAWATGFAPWTGGVLLAAGQTGAVAIVLSPGASVAGTVRDADGAPLASTVEYANPTAFAHAAITTGPDGTFTLDDLPVGRVELRARQDRATDTATLDLTAGTTTRWDPVLRAGAGIAGVVLAPDGRPLAGARVGTFTPDEIAPVTHVRTGRDGRFAFADVGTSPVDLEVLLEGHDAFVIVPAIAPGTDDCVVQLRVTDLPTARLRARFIDADGRPVPAQVAALRAASTRSAMVPNDPITGSVSVGPLPAGRVRLTVYTDGLGNLALAPIDLPPDADHDLGDIVLHRPGSAAIVAFVDDPRALYRAAARVYTHDGEFVASAELSTAAQNEGECRFETLQPGAYFVVGDFGPMTAGADLQIESGRTALVALHAAVGHRAKVRFRDPLRPKTPPVTVTIVASRPDGSFAGLFGTFGSTTPPTGSVTLPPGRYRLACRASDDRTVTADLTIPDRAAPIELEITLPTR